MSLLFSCSFVCISGLLFCMVCVFFFVLFFWTLVRVVCLFFFFVFKQKTPYGMRISDWSSDVCSSELGRVHELVAVLNMARPLRQRLQDQELGHGKADAPALPGAEMARRVQRQLAAHQRGLRHLSGLAAVLAALIAPQQRPRSDKRRARKACVETGRIRGNPKNQ